MRLGSVFSGIGLLDYGLHLAGFEHRWLVERDEWRRGILAKRFPGVPIFDDIRAVGAANLERVECLAGGFPCKGVSDAGPQTGFGHPETVLWREMARCVRELRPRYVLVENVSALLRLHDGECFGEVVGDLASFGYDLWWDCIPASAVGAPHGRDRVFIVAYADREGLEGSGLRGPAHDGAAEAPADTGSLGRESRVRPRTGGTRAPASSATGREADGLGRGRSADGSREVAADADEQRPVQQPQGHGPSRPLGVEAGENAAGRGVAVEWGEYEPAVRRWEALLGRACPEPLLRRMDDGSTSGLVKPRLSALGDGVHVGVARVVGQMILDHAS